MVTRAELSDIAAALPDVMDDSSEARTLFTIGGEKFAWTYMRRYHPRQARRPDPDVLAIACDLGRKALLVEADPALFFDDNHYAGFPAVMIRLPAADRERMAELLKQACDFQKSRPKRRR